jgi:hypothetical protein
MNINIKIHAVRNKYRPDLEVTVGTEKFNTNCTLRYSTSHYTRGCALWTVPYSTKYAPRYIYSNATDRLFQYLCF